MASEEPVIHSSEATLPFGIVTNAATSGWAVIHVERLEVVGDRLYASESEALAAAAATRERYETERRAAANFDEELTLYEETRDD